MAANDEITRVRYFDGEFLRAVDFEDEQSYERDARRRHVLAHHTWGIVVGLELKEVPIAGQSDVVDVVLEPGVAIDGFGRELVSYHPVKLDPAAFDAFHTDAHQSVWLGYQEDQSGALSSNWTDCQDSAAIRITEGWTIVVSPPSPQTDPVIVDGSVASPPPNTSGGPEIPADESVPYQELPETSPGDRWLIRLGTVHWDGTQQSFRPAAAGRLLEDRTYVGAVAGHVYSPADTLEVAQRTAPSDLDAADFVTVDGRLRVKGRINAEKEVWIEGGRIRFTLAAGEEDNTLLTLGRQQPPGGAAGNILRLRIGEVGDASTALTIGPGQDATAEDALRVRADDVVEIPGPKGMLAFGHDTRQMIDLWASAGGHQYGIGVQSETQYFRSDSSFCWFKGGKHADGASDPGAGGQLQLRLDEDGSLQFGTRVRQMLNLWSTNYGIGVQSWTLYFRSDADFCWYRGGIASDNRDDPGGGTRAMMLDSSSNLSVLGQMSAGGNLNVGGDLVVTGHAPSVIKVKRYERVKQNAGQGVANSWSENVSGDFTEVYEAFAVLNGFSIYTNTSTTFNNFGHNADVNSIPQHAYVRVTSVFGTTISLEAYCSESLPAQEADNSILLTLVVIGRHT